LVEAASKGNASLGCSVFIGISFTLYAFRYVPRMVEFPTKSGGWLNTVKVVLGFLDGFSFQILVKCGLSATIAFAGREVFFGYLVAILEH
jgi:thiol:disulfide interchange protein